MDTVAVSPTKTLKDLRIDSGLTLVEIAKRLAKEMGIPSLSHVAILKLEENGTRDIDKLEALARVFGHKDISIVREASRASAELQK